MPPGARPYRPSGQAALGGVSVPLELAIEAGSLSFLSTTTVFGTALDISLSELTIESFFPADPATTEAMRRLGEAAEAG